MAFVTKYGNSGFPLWLGTMAETKRLDLGDGAYAIETDSPGKLYRFLGGVWSLLAVGGVGLVAAVGTPISDQGADLSVGTTALSAAFPQAIPYRTSHIRFQLKPVTTPASTAWVNIKLGVVSVVVTPTTGTAIVVGDGALIVPVPVGATFFDAIAGEALTLNWTPS